MKFKLTYPKEWTHFGCFGILFQINETLYEVGCHLFFIENDTSIETRSLIGIKYLLLEEDK